MKHRTHKLAAKAVATILCAALMLTACGSKETTSNETAVTETTSVESTEVTTTETTVAEPTAEPTEAPTEAPTETAPASTVEPTAAPTETTTAADTGYTYSEVSQTMYAKSAVNVRDLPSTDGKKIGSLKASQEIAVTGKCDQTGWYRFDLNGTTGYVSDKYIVSEKPVANTVASTGNSNTATNTQQNTAAPAATPAPAQTTTTTGTTDTSGEYIDRAMAEQVFALVNAERTAAGIPALIWSEDLYNTAVQRCYENDGHASVRPGMGENYSEGQQSADEIYQSWHDSPGHHDNYMNPNYTYSAVAVRVVPLMGGALGNIHIHYQLFTYGDSAQSVANTEPVIVENPVAAAPKTADEDTSASSSNVGWSMTPPTQEDGLKKWQEQNPDVEVSFGN